MCHCVDQYGSTWRLGTVYCVVLTSVGQHGCRGAVDCVALTSVDQHGCWGQLIVLHGPIWVNMAAGGKTEIRGLSTSFDQCGPERLVYEATEPGHFGAD